MPCLEKHTVKYVRVEIAPYNRAFVTHDAGESNVVSVYTNDRDAYEALTVCQRVWLRDVQFHIDFIRLQLDNPREYPTD
jgi:hypothetical protein